MSIFGDFFRMIGKLIKKLNLGDLFKDWFAGDNTQEVLKNFTSYGVTIVERFKLGLQDPTLKTVTDLLPGDWDSNIVNSAEEVANDVLDKLTQGNECANKETFAEKFSCYMDMIENKGDKFEKSKGLIGLAANISFELANKVVGKKELDINKIFALVPALYVELFKKK